MIEDIPGGYGVPGMPNRVLEPEEIVLAGKVLSFLDEVGTGEGKLDAAHVRDVMDLLGRLRKVATSYTSIIRSHSVAGELRDVHTLTNAICRSDPYSIEAPTWWPSSISSACWCACAGTTCPRASAGGS